MTEHGQETVNAATIQLMQAQGNVDSYFVREVHAREVHTCEVAMTVALGLHKIGLLLR